MLLLGMLLVTCCIPAPASRMLLRMDVGTACACGDRVRLRSLPLPANENIYNTKYLLQNTSETGEIFET
jgi:hypothetical protein